MRRRISPPGFAPLILRKVIDGNAESIRRSYETGVDKFYVHFPPLLAPQQGCYSPGTNRECQTGNDAANAGAARAEFQVGRSETTVVRSRAIMQRSCSVPPPRCRVCPRPASGRGHVHFRQRWREAAFYLRQNAGTKSIKTVNTSSLPTIIIRARSHFPRGWTWA
jgi:hypothetical protein